MAKGKVLGIKEGQIFNSCLDLSRNSVHQYQNKNGKSKTAPGIVTDRDGVASSVLLNGGYVDDEDNYDQIIYTGSGGQDDRKIQISDQVIEGRQGRNNLGLINAYNLETPLRLIRGYKHKSEYAPSRGYRYDGLFYIKKVWWDQSIHGPVIIRFELIHEDRFQGKGNIRL